MGYHGHPPPSSPRPVPRPPDPVTYHGQQFLEIKMAGALEVSGPGRAAGPAVEPGRKEGRLLPGVCYQKPPTPRAGAPDEDGEPVCHVQQRSAPASMPIMCECLSPHPPGSPVTLPWPPTRCSLFLQAGSWRP